MPDTKNLPGLRVVGFDASSPTSSLGGSTPVSTSTSLMTSPSQKTFTRAQLQEAEQKAEQEEKEQLKKMLFKYMYHSRSVQDLLTEVASPAELTDNLVRRSESARLLTRIEPSKRQAGFFKPIAGYSALAQIMHPSQAFAAFDKNHLVTLTQHFAAIAKMYRDLADKKTDRNLPFFQFAALFNLLEKFITDSPTRCGQVELIRLFTHLLRAAFYIEALFQLDACDAIAARLYSVISEADLKRLYKMELNTDINYPEKDGNLEVGLLQVLTYSLRYLRYEEPKVDSVIDILQTNIARFERDYFKSTVTPHLT